MITPKDLRALSPEDETQLARANQYIDKNIQASFDQDPKQTTFSIARKGLSQYIKKLDENGQGLSARVRDRYIEDASKAGWNVELTGDAIVLSFKRRGRRTKAQIAADNAVVEAAPEVTVVEADEMETVPAS